MEQALCLSNVPEAAPTATTATTATMAITVAAVSCDRPRLVGTVLWVTDAASNPAGERRACWREKGLAASHPLLHGVARCAVMSDATLPGSALANK